MVSEMTNSDFVLDVLTLLDKYDDYDIFWRVENGQVRFWTNCNDLFWWATADGEELTPENLPILRQCYEDCKAACVIGTVYAQSLFACRMRGMRPQGAAYPKSDPEMWALFDAAGPPRETDRGAFGNPKPHPAYTAPSSEAP